MLISLLNLLVGVPALYLIVRVRRTMATFDDLKQIGAQIQNNNLAQNNAIAAQIAEASEILQELSAALKKGQGPTPEDLDSVVKQLRSVDELIQQNTAAIQESTDQMKAADPNPPPATEPTGDNTGQTAVQ